MSILLSPNERELIDGHSFVELVDKAYGRQLGEEFPVLRIRHSASRCDIALQGAQVLSFTPAGGRDLLWVSPGSNFESGKAVRGGIPICLPWFGVDRRNPENPAHGFARNSRWQLSSIESQVSAQRPRLAFSFDSFQTEPHPLFPWCFSAELIVTISESLSLDLAVTNWDESPMPLTLALHSYHKVSDVSRVWISGLEGYEYLDNTNGLSRKIQEGSIRFNGELDRAYLNVSDCQVIDVENTRDSEAIVIQSSAPSAVVWNPGKEKAAEKSDLGADNANKFVCLERGAVFDNEELLFPGETSQFNVTISSGLNSNEPY